ncbi:UNVERIFIED_CONTAM: hypothetical protein PYX00_002400 [Menopon gallinae]|uniref:Glypican-5 n=1 Tax=Menopon gallinae TaxID=328185 RepID=A0AAW2II77_9NEOP
MKLPRNFKIMTKMNSIVAAWTLLCINSVACSPFVGGGRPRTTATCDDVESLIVSPALRDTIPPHPINGSHKSICNGHDYYGSCCNHEVEKELMTQVKKTFRDLLYHNPRSVEGVLATTTRMLEDYMTEMILHSENKTLTIFRQAFDTMAVLATEPIHKLYSHIIHLGTENRDRIDVTLRLENAVHNFFRDLFPLVYHRNVNPNLRDYSNDYKRCLRGTISEIKPFGHVPKELGEKLGKTMKAVKVFLDALEVGMDVLNQTVSLFESNNNDRCHVELYRMYICPKCNGVKAKPCNGYCLNVLRGCLTQFSSQLDLPWSGYVESLGQLVRGNEEETRSPYSHLIDDVEDIVRSLDTEISRGILIAMQDGKSLEEKVKRACGAPQWSADEDQPLPVDRPYNAQELLTEARPADIRVTPYVGRNVSRKLKEAEKQLSIQLENFLLSMTKEKGFYDTVAESLCSDEFAEVRDTAECWNGQAVGEYTKVVISASVSAQRYNPEFKLSTEISMSHLSEKLRSVRQAIMGVLSPPLSNDMYLRDEEGSGSGYPTDRGRYPDDDDDETNIDGEGSGSGYSEIEKYNPDSPYDTHVLPEDRYRSSSQRHFTSWSLLISTWVCRRYIFNYFLS